MVFEVTVSKDGDVTKINMTEISDTVSFELIQKFEEYTRKLNFSPTQAQTVVSKGKITYCIIKENGD